MIGSKSQTGRSVYVPRHLGLPNEGIQAPASSVRRTPVFSRA